MRRPDQREGRELGSAGTPGTLRCASRTINEGNPRCLDGVGSGLESNTGAGRLGPGPGPHAAPTGARLDQTGLDRRLASVLLVGRDRPEDRRGRANQRIGSLDDGSRKVVRLVALEESPSGIAGRGARHRPARTSTHFAFLAEKHLVTRHQVGSRNPDTRFDRT